MFVLKSADLFPIAVDGTCDDLAAGVIKIEMRIGACPNYGDNDGQVGWKNSRQMTVMEIVPRPSSSED